MRRVAWPVAAAVLLAGLAATVGAAGSDRLLLLNLVLIYGIFAVGYDLAFGVAGLLSLGHAALFGAGAYLLANLTLRMGWPFEAALVAAGLGGALLAAAMAAVALRLTGIFFALVTLAMGQLCFILASNHLRGWTGGLDGLSGVPRPRWGGWDFADDRLFLLYDLAVFAALFVVSMRLRRSPFGQVVAATRLDPVRVAALGWQANRFRVAVFALSGFYAGVAGALQASLLFFASPQIMDWTTSGDVLIMTVLGGSGTLVGPFLGAAAFELLRDELSRWTDRWYGLLGLIFVLVTLFAPGGLAGLLRRRQRT